MKSWREVVLPHADIRKGKFDESVFAADLSDVRAGRGPLEYRDAQTFFRKTYPTQGLVNLLDAVLSRLSGRGVGEPVIQIQTPFGGGKTHSLIALYHLFLSREDAGSSQLGKKVLEESGVDGIPEARVAVFVGTAADPVRGKTPWGEIAHQLGAYDLVREHDKKRRAPGKDVLHKVLGDRPTLVLMDEIAQYAVKAKDFAGQVTAFFQELTEAVKVIPRSALVVTLPSSAPYGEEGERRLSELQRIFGRIEAIYTPVEGEEMYAVIRERLFEETPDYTEARRVADRYWDLYRNLGDDVPRDVREPAYRDKIRKAYPFHPQVIDILFERWSTYSTFQRTRGVLRLLAEIVSDLYRREHPAPLIQPAHIDLANPTIRREFLKHIGNEYEGVIASDIADGGAKAGRIDEEMGSEYARFGVARGLAAGIFFGSFSAGERKGIAIQRLRVMTLREGLPPAVIGDALRRLEDELWYLHVEGGLYAFRSQPNLNRIIIEKEEAVKDENIQEEIRARLEKVCGREMPVYLWPSASTDVPDTKQLKLAVLGPEHSRTSTSDPPVAEELLTRSGQTFRVYQNTALVLAADSGEWAGLRAQVKRFLALRAIKDDKALSRRLHGENRRTLENKLKDSEGSIDFKILSAYRHLAKNVEKGMEWHNLGLPTAGVRTTLANRVGEYLGDKDLLVDLIKPGTLLAKTLSPEDKEKPVNIIIEDFLKYPHLPILASEDVVWRAIATGVREGVFGLRVGEKVYFKEPVPSGAESPDAVLVREVVPPPPPPGTITPEDIACRLEKDKWVTVRKIYEDLWKERGKEFAEQAAFDQAFEEALKSGKEQGLFILDPAVVSEKWSLGEILEKCRVKPAKPAPPPPPSPPTHYHLRVRVPWDKLSDFVRGVVMPLRNDGAELTVEVVLDAEGSVRKETIDHKVRETLRQIGAEVEEERDKA